MSKIDARLDEWKRKLIDLSRRNRLLFFKETRSSSLKVVEPTPNDVFSRLVVNERSWNFFIPPEENDGQAEPAQPSRSRLVRRAHELLCQLREAQKLRAVLRNLYRRSKSDFQERGVRILHMVFGILEWKETPQSEPIRSPLVLVPVAINRRSANDPYSLCVVGEEIVLNPAIEVRLWNDFHISLPSLPDGWEENDLDKYLVKVEKKVSPQGWKVHRECRLGLFSFHKLVIYQDLESHKEQIKQNRIVGALAGETDIHDEGGVYLSDPRQLDTLVNPKQSYLILDADSSQLACIESVKNGTNLVIQGPPGTGKSQTIANLIAESIATGKTVLFVSEKMAALDVVYKRLKNSNLGHYCLELHSHKANKREVVAELYQSYHESLKPKNVMTELEFQQLLDRRCQLNDYVNALHFIRDPLTKSAYDVLGELAELEKVPFVPPGEIQPEGLNPARVDLAIQLAKRLALVWKVVSEGEKFPWRGCVITSYSRETQDSFQEMIGNCEDAMTALREEGLQLAKILGFSVPSSLSDTQWLLHICEILGEGPGVEKAWFVARDLKELIFECRQNSDLSSQFFTIRSVLCNRYSDTFFHLPLELKDEMTNALSSVFSSLGWELHKEQHVAPQLNSILHWVQDFIDRLADWNRYAERLSNILDIPLKNHIDGLWRLVRIGELCLCEDRPDAKWLDPVILEEVPVVLNKVRRDQEARTAARSRILQDYQESFLSLDLAILLDTFSTRFDSALRWIKPGFYRFRRQIRRYRKDGKFPEHVLRDLSAAGDLVRLEARIETESSQTKEVLGNWYHGYDTNFARAERSIPVARELAKLISGTPSERLVRQACYGTLPSSEIGQLIEQLKKSLTEWEKLTGTIGGITTLDRFPPEGTPLRQSQFNDILPWCKKILQPLKIAVALLDTVKKCFISDFELGIEGILNDLSQLTTLRDLESQILSNRERLLETYGSRFSGLETDWDAVLDAIEWASKVRNHLAALAIPQQVLEIATQGAKSAPKVDLFRDRIKEFKEVFNEFSSKFEEVGESAKAGFLMTAEQKLHETLPEHEPATRQFVQLGFESLERLLLDMRIRIAELRDWVDYKKVEKDFREGNLLKLHTELINRPSLRSHELPDIVRRALLQAWIDWLFKYEKPLSRFRSQDHEAMIQEFQELDRKHCELGAARVIQKLELHKPKGLVHRGGEAAVLFREANKKKRHLPIRHLFSQIPNLLMRLKPCLLMSPLSVSQFLDPNQIMFDLVVFDEASQICSEDAVGAIYRGRQLCICGDSKQLPPTAFFEQGMSDEFEDQDADEAFDVFPSILEECAGIILPQSWLRWHYRSRHESLIAFSNRIFYEDRLVTFPASRQKHPTLGIDFIHISDGVYDRGGRSDNPREAEIVVDLIKEHFLTYPNRSLGVVTFSIAQMSAIEDRVEQLRRNHPELERYFAEDRLEGFFVKNLERVQGDERDVIIFSVGYGKDRNGKLEMRFGPLNHPGGDQRLNVAITRAREKVKVVSSIRAADFDLSRLQTPGVKVLYQYLDYAERGPDALALQRPVASGDFESPLEREVAGEIRALGYDIFAQVGCSGYRIDIGVVDPVEPGRFILGVECDGATYHSAYTARDRDRLRGEVLKNLGWKIHRVWAPDWVTQRVIEVNRLKLAIEQALAPADAKGSNPNTSSSRAHDLTNRTTVTIASNPLMDYKGGIPSWTVPYKVCKLQSRTPRGFQFHDSAAKDHLSFMLKEVIRVEGPLHVDVAARRLADARGRERVGGRMMKAIRSAINKLTKEGAADRRRKFIWPKRSGFSLKVRRPDPDDPDSSRNIEYICDEELELAIQNIVRDAMSIPEDELITGTARIFAFDRTGENIRKRIKWSIQHMIREGTVVQRGGRISVDANNKN